MFYAQAAAFTPVALVAIAFHATSLIRAFHPVAYLIVSHTAAEAVTFATVKSMILLFPHCLAVADTT
jgi:hypothetical protein